MSEEIPEKYRSLIAPSEKVLYVAMEKGSMIKLDLKKRLMPDCIVVTDRRMIYFQPKGLIRGALGMEDYVDYPFADMKNIELDRGMKRATLKITPMSLHAGGKMPEIKDIDKKDAEDIFAIVREILMKKEKESQRPLVITAQPEQPSSKEDPIALLKRLASLRDAGVISAEEFEQKKKELLSKI